MEEREATVAMTGGEEQNLGISSDLIRGHISTIILRCLYDEDKYGYDIIGEIERKSGGLYTIKQPTLYSALKRLESDKYVESYYGEQSNGGRRKYFRLSEAGRTYTEKSLADWEYSRTIIDSLISDGEAHFDFSFITEKQSELGELKRSLASREQALEEEKIALNNLRNELQRERALLATQSSTIQTQKTDVKELKDKLDEQSKELEIKVQALTDKETLLIAKEEELRIAKAELDEQTSQILTLKTLLQTQKDDYEAQAQILRSTQDKVSALQDENKTLKEQTLELSALRNTTAEADALRVKLASTLQELTDSHSMVERLREAVARQEQTIDSLRISLDDKSSSFTARELDLQSKQAQLLAQKDKLDEEKARVDKLFATCQSLQEQIDEKENELENERIALQSKAEALDAKQQQIAEEATRIENAKESLQLERTELDKKSYELSQTEFRLDEQQRTIFDKVAVTENQNENLLHRQEDLDNLELELAQAKQKLQEELQSLQAQQRDLASRQTIYNQQQLEFITRKNAFTAQQYDLTEKLNAYATQLQQLEESQEKLEAEKQALRLDQNALEERIQAFNEEKSLFNSSKQKFLEEKAEAEQQQELLRQQIYEERIQLQQEAELLQAKANTPAPTPVNEPTPASNAPSSFYEHVYSRAQSEGIKINTSGYSANNAPYPAYSAETQTRGYYNAGQTFFKSAFIVFCIVLFESLLVFFMKDYLGVPFIYPAVGFAGGFILFIVSAILFACGFKPIARRKKHASYIVTSTIMFVITVIIITMIAVYCKAPITQPEILLSFVVIPVVYCLNMVFLSIFYRLFSLKNVTVTK